MNGPSSVSATKNTGCRNHSFGQAIDPSIAVEFCNCGLVASEVVPSSREASISSVYEVDVKGQFLPSRAICTEVARGASKEARAQLVTYYINQKNQGMVN